MYLPNKEHTYLCIFFQTYLPTDLLIIWFHEYFDTTNLRNLMLLLYIKINKPTQLQERKS